MAILALLTILLGVPAMTLTSDGSRASVAFANVSNVHCLEP
jgi:hypothetical protein